jgi:pyridoxamine 5'-phosphate oxidase
MLTLGLMIENPDPLVTLVAWRDEAKAAGAIEPDAMALATATPGGVPSVRIVLFRGLSPEGAIRFFTNYESRKARDLDLNPRAAAVFHWAALARQVRIEGMVARLPGAASDEYFAGRPRLSQLSAWVSPQSRPIESLAELIARRTERQLALAGGPVPRPPFWGGYGMKADRIELWTSGEGRLHDRRLFEASEGTWTMTRLAP